jgi:hypothetical protein
LRAFYLRRSLRHSFLNFLVFSFFDNPVP